MNESSFISSRTGKESAFRILAAMTLLSSASICYSQDSASVPADIPITRLFHDIGANSVGAFTYNYGLNYLDAALITYGIVGVGFDWKWYRISVDNKWIGNAGFASVAAGGLVPLTVPLGLYLYGRLKGNPDLQATGLALGQAALLGLAISSGIKVFTGRVPPDNLGNQKDYSGDFRFGFWRGGAFEGWPSSHTTIAFAMSAALADLYPNNTMVMAGAMAYASFIGLGVSTNIHWLSDAVAGAFIGYAIGKAVGKGFSDLRKPEPKERRISFVITPTNASIAYSF